MSTRSGLKPFSYSASFSGRRLSLSGRGQSSGCVPRHRQSNAVVGVAANRPLQDHVRAAGPTANKAMVVRQAAVERQLAVRGRRSLHGCREPVWIACVGGLFGRCTAAPVGTTRRSPQLRGAVYSMRGDALINDSRTVFA